MSRLEEIEARKAEIKNEIPNATSEQLEELKQETENLLEEERMINTQVAERALENNINEQSKIVQNEISIEEKNIGGNNMEELRNSKKYINAYANYIKSSLDKRYEMSSEDAALIKEAKSLNKEERALITTDGYATGNSATVVVPDMVENIVRTAWEKENLIALVKRTSVPGNLKIQFEVSGDAAVIHQEGNGAVNEETLVLGVVELPAKSIKKWISVSDEVLDMKGEEFLNYIYDELTYRIAKKCADELINIIKTLPQSLSANGETGVYDKVSAAKIESAPGVDTIVKATSKLSDEARDITIVMNKETDADFIAAQLAANYGFDVYRNHRVVYNNSLPAYQSASAGAVYVIVGDFDIGSQLNFPNGDDITIKYDDKTAMEYDLVRILGREYVGMNAVADKAFTLIAKPAETSE